MDIYLCCGGESDVSSQYGTHLPTCVSVCVRVQLSEGTAVGHDGPGICSINCLHDVSGGFKTAGAREAERDAVNSDSN